MFYMYDGRWILFKNQRIFLISCMKSFTMFRHSKSKVDIFYMASVNCCRPIYIFDVLIGIICIPHLFTKFSLHWSYSVKGLSLNFDMGQVVIDQIF